MLLAAMLVGVLAAYLRMLAGATSLEDSLAHNVIHGLTNGA
jgi:hypothetical protein